MNILTGQSNKSSSSVEVLYSQVTLACTKLTKTSQYRGDKTEDYKSGGAGTNMIKTYYVYVLICHNDTYHYV